MTRAALLPLTTFLIAIAFFTGSRANAHDWPCWGGQPSRNMLATTEESPLPAGFKPPNEHSGNLNQAGQNIRWSVPLGSQTFGNPVVANGRVLVGTNNGPADEADHKDLGVLLCLDAATGKTLWRHEEPKLRVGNVSDWEECGICSSPAVAGDRVYVVANTCQVICLDLNSKDRATVLWRYDMRDELGVFPLNMTSSSPLVVDGRVYVSTSNSVDWTLKHTPNPAAPALIALDAKTGRLLGAEASGISGRTFHSNWCSPSFGRAADRDLLLFGGGDGWVYAFDPIPVKTDGKMILRELWRYDANPPSRKVLDGKPLKYGSANGPGEVIATPVCVDGRVYASTGQSPESGDGAGALHCINPDGTGDLTETGRVWLNELVRRSLSTPAVVGKLLFTADIAGHIRCVDIATGNELWTHDAESNVWASPLVADGRLYIGAESGAYFIFDAAGQKKLIAQIEFDDPIYSSTIVADRTLYVATSKRLYAIADKAR